MVKEVQCSTCPVNWPPFSQLLVQELRCSQLPWEYAWQLFVSPPPIYLVIVTAPYSSTLAWEDPLEEGMATHSSILAWRIPMNGGVWPALRIGHD